MKPKKLLKLVQTGLSEIKAQDIKLIDVAGRSSFTEMMIIATGTSSRHVKSIADTIALKAKRAGHPALGMEGEMASEWILLDLDDIVLHVMLAHTRDLYNLEALWEVKIENRIPQLT